MSSVKVTVRRSNIDLDKFKEGKCRVGFFETARYPQETDEKGRVTRKSVPVAMVARINEFGLGVPMRAFMRPALHQNKDKLVEILRHKYQQAIKDNDDTMKVLEEFGMDCKGMVQDQISSTTSPGNAPITIHGGWMRSRYTGKPIYIKGKGKNTPLRDSNIMLHSVSYQTEEMIK